MRFLTPALLAIIITRAEAAPQQPAATQVPSLARSQQVQSEAYLRLEFMPAHLSYAPKSQTLAFTDAEGHGLYVVNVEDRKIYRVTDEKIGPAFFWSPDGKRLFFRALTRPNPKELSSVLAAYDMALRKTITLGSLPSLTGFLTFDPRDYRLAVMHEKGVMVKKLVYPDNKLAKWQMAQRTDKGRFLATPGGILWLSNSGLSMRRLPDDGSKVMSFTISPDGLHIAWATAQGAVYTSQQGEKPVRIGLGSDPQWHPSKNWLSYAAARLVGDKVIQHDIKIVDHKGAQRFLTLSQDIDERWPVWLDDKTLVYAAAGSTDIYRMVLP